MLLAACTAAESPDGNTVTGEVVDATMNTLTIKTDDGQELTFMTEGADTSGLSNGLTVGEEVTVTYDGDIEGTDTSNTAVTYIKDA